MYRPAAHAVHTVEAGDALYVPGAHASHCAAPSRSWCRPGGHDVHAAGDACPSSALKRPAAHWPHEPPALGLYVPAGQELHVRVVPLNSAPAAHETHLLRSGVGTVSPSHRRHSPDAAPAKVAPVQAEQTALRQKVAALGPKLLKDFGTPWQTIDTAQSSVRAMYLPYRFVEGGPMGSELFGYARELVRAAAEREKPSVDRLPGYADADLPRLQKSLFDEVPVHADLEEVTLEFWLSKAREYLGVDDADTQLLLGKESPEQLAERLVSQTRLSDPDYRRQLWDGGLQAIEASKDPLIQYALKLEPRQRALKRQVDENYQGPLTAAGGKLAEARFAAYGNALYPDATFTLRISYGQVKGWTERGRPVPYATTMGGTFDRATGSAPFDLPTAFAANRKAIDPATTYDFVTTNDIIGGNSGSPVIDRSGAVIGAAFDGNIHSLGGNYGYDPALNRTVVVSTDAVQEALEKLYPAPALVAELKAR